MIVHIPKIGTRNPKPVYSKRHTLYHDTTHLQITSLPYLKKKKLFLIKIHDQVCGVNTNRNVRIAFFSEYHYYFYFMLHLDGLVANNDIVEILKQNMTGYLFYFLLLYQYMYYYYVNKDKEPDLTIH